MLEGYADRPAYQMGMAVFHALDEQVTVAVLRELLEQPGAGTG